MIKLIFSFLLIINICILLFFGFSKDSEELPNKKIERIITQINPSIIKLINDGIAKSENNQSDVIYSNNDVSTCIEANLASESEVLFMKKELENTLTNVQSRIISSTQTGSFIVYAKDTINLKKQIAELRRLKIVPISIGSINNNQVAMFGVFSNRPKAIEYTDSLQLRGVKNANIAVAQDTTMNIFWLRLPYANIDEEGFLRKISSKYGIINKYCQ